MRSEILKVEAMLYDGSNLRRIQKFINKSVSYNSITSRVTYGSGVSDRGYISQGSYIMKLTDNSLRAVRFVPQNIKITDRSGVVKGNVIRHVVDNIEDIRKFVGAGFVGYANEVITIKSALGMLNVEPGDYIFKSIDGQISALNLS